MTEEIKERAYGFEAVKTALRQTKDGISITLVIHPHDTPRDLINDHIGQRYMVGMGRLNEQDEIEEPESVREGKRAVVSCAALCRDEDFQQWLYDNGFVQDLTEKEAAEAIRLMLQIESRSELKTNEEAQRRWGRVKELFIGRLIFEETDLE
tara:strand:+ start:100 stop:555 length:456 start_codon:yes stop_codon:yes gene_type:complete